MFVSPSYVVSKRFEMMEYIDFNPKTVLDVGCRESYLLAAIKEKYKNVETTGIEPDESTLDVLKKNADIVINDYFSKELDLKENYYDVIFFNDVLEHIYDPWDALIYAKKLLTVDGIIVVSLPNLRYKLNFKKLLFNDEFEYVNSGVMDISHIRFFTEKSMRKMFNDCGLTLQKFVPVGSYKNTLFKKVFHYITGRRFLSTEYIQFISVLSR